MTDPHFEKIRDYIKERSRLSFSGHKRGVLRQRLESRLAQLDIADLGSYWSYLRRTPDEERRLYDVLTTNETFFFRNMEQFRFLRQEILPALETARGTEVVKSWGGAKKILPATIMKLRILCAGCSTGEEPYSVAMTVLEGLRYPKAWDVEIVAGDLSESCLRTAARGFYDEERLQGLPDGYLDRYLEPCTGGATMREEVKGLVRFVPLNLNEVMNGGDVPGCGAGEGFDIIFCRNVMIYFGSACQQLLIDTLYRLAAPGGYLFTGDAEPLHLFSHDFSAVQSAGCLIYQKRTERERDGEFN